MNINELERLTGITKQNIRFYEKKGLLHPARNSENNYREYTKEDLTRLKAVKLLRKLDLPLEDIRKILQDEELLSEALSQHLKTLQEKQQELSACIDVCNNLLQKAKSQAAQPTLWHRKVQTDTLSDMGPDSMQSNTAQTSSSIDCSDCCTGRCRTDSPAAAHGAQSTAGPAGHRRDTTQNG